MGSSTKEHLDQWLASAEDHLNNVTADEFEAGYNQARDTYPDGQTITDWLASNATPIYGGYAWKPCGACDICLYHPESDCGQPIRITKE